MWISPAKAAAYAVDSNADAPDSNTGDDICKTASDNCTLRAAIQQANASAEADQITIPGYEITLNTSLPPITDSAGLSISGLSAADTVIDANSSGRAFKIDNGATEFANLKITGGNPASSFASPGWGGGILVDGGSLALDGVAMEGNTIGQGGIGGAIASEGPLTITDSSISFNSAAYGGGIYIRDAGSLVLNGNSVVDNNDAYAGSGGGIYLQNGTASIDESTLSENEAEGASGYGGAIYSQSSTGPTTLSINNTEIAGNLSDQTGGAIHLTHGTTSIESTDFAGNSASQGGAISVSASIASASLTLDETKFSDNHAIVGTGGRYGGALMMAEYDGNNASVSVENSLFTANSAVHSGGSIHIWEGDLEAINTTFSGNSASSYGGAVNNAGSGSVSFLNTTIVENHAGTGGGGLSKIGTSATDPILENTILANNTVGGAPTPSDCHGGITSNGYNILETIPSTCTVTGAQTDDQQETDPQLGSLDDNGGPTETHGLMEHSPALDSADNTSCPSTSTDQRGFPRPTDGPDDDTTKTCDIGAYETLTMSVDDESVVEGDPPGNTPMPFELTLDAPVPENVEVDVELVHGTTHADDFANPNDCNYAGNPIPCNSRIVIDEGESSTTFTVRVAADDLDESDETFTLGLESGSLLVLDGEVEGTIEDDDDPPPVGHGRDISLNLRRHLIAKGRVTVEDGFNACRKQVPVKVQKKRPSGKWKTLVTIPTSKKGFYKSKIADKRGTYRALAPKKNLTIETQVHNCAKAKSPQRKHGH